MEANERASIRDQAAEPLNATSLKRMYMDLPALDDLEFERKYG